MNVVEKASANLRPNAVDFDRFRLRRFVEQLGDELTTVEGPTDLAEVAHILEGNPKAVHFRAVGPERQELVGNFQGMTFGPRFSPDGQKVIFALAMQGKSNIYSLDLKTRQQTQLTRGGALDVSPSYSPDSKRVVFSSDRGGRPNLYTMNADGSNAQRISL